MRYTLDPFGNTKFIYDSEFEYRTHGAQLKRTHGKRQILQEGKEDGKYIRILREK